MYMGKQWLSALLSRRSTDVTNLGIWVLSQIGVSHVARVLIDHHSNSQQSCLRVHFLSNKFHVESSNAGVEWWQVRLLLHNWWTQQMHSFSCMLSLKSSLYLWSETTACFNGLRLLYCPGLYSTTTKNWRRKLTRARTTKGKAKIELEIQCDRTWKRWSDRDTWGCIHNVAKKTLGNASRTNEMQRKLNEGWSDGEWVGYTK